MKGKLGLIFDKVTSPQAYSMYAAIGVGVTVVLAILNTRKQCQIEYEKKSQEGYLEKEITREDVKEEVKQVAKTYAPTVASAIATIACINKAENKFLDCLADAEVAAGLCNSAYLASQKRLAQLKSVVPGALMVKAHDYIREKPDAKDLKWFCIQAIGDFPDLYFQATESDMWRAQLKLNRNYHIRGSASLREFLAFLEVLDQFDSQIKEKLDEDGDEFGWDIDVLFELCPEVTPWIDFNFKQDENGIIYVIPDDWLNPPMYHPDRSPFAYGYQLHPCD